MSLDLSKVEHILGNAIFFTILQSKKHCQIIFKYLIVFCQTLVKFEASKIDLVIMILNLLIEMTCWKTNSK